MIVTCKVCQTKYYIQQSSCMQAKKLRCTYCDYVWIPEDTNTVNKIDYKDKKNHIELSNNDDLFYVKLLNSKYLLIILILILLISSMFFWRHNLLYMNVDIVPSFLKQYEHKDVRIINFTSERITKEQGVKFIINADIVNTSKHLIKGTRFVLELYDIDNKLLSSERINIKDLSILSNETYKFNYSIECDERAYFVVIKVMNILENILF